MLLGIRLLETTFWVWIVKPSGRHCTGAFGGKEYRRVPTPLRSTSPVSHLRASDLANSTAGRSCHARFAACRDRVSLAPEDRGAQRQSSPAGAGASRLKTPVYSHIRQRWLCGSGAASRASLPTPEATSDSGQDEGQGEGEGEGEGEGHCSHSPSNLDVLDIVHRST